MGHLLNNKKVAILVTDGFEEIELVEPKDTLERQGAEVHLVSPLDIFSAWDSTDCGEEYEADVRLEDADAEIYDALVIPGGMISCDHLRFTSDALDFVRTFMENGKPVAALSYGPWLLAEADCVHEKKLTSDETLKSDLEDAGAIWIDQPYCIDGSLITCRGSEDLKDFISSMVRVMARPVMESESIPTPSSAPLSS